ncbi:unnamed protein product [Owenia fusiformis]|uniref:Uncharacterized protein n=1 Tax=Owenia fusiformis TaxID=6347 RepID=A0A8J1U9G4_OWEFU|nr:unnamed protein product [Owenia fusiformis]
MAPNNITLPMTRDNNHDVPIGVTVSYIILSEITSVLILVINILTVITIAKVESLHTVMNKLFVNLACADLLLGVSLPYCSLRFYQLDMVYSSLMLEKISCLVCQYVTLATASVSFLGFSLIALDRYLAITQPLMYHQLMTKKRLLGAVIFIWLFVFNVLGIMIGLNNWRSGTQCTGLLVLNRAMYSIVILGLGGLLSITSAMLYARIFYIAWQQKKRIQAEEISYGQKCANSDTKMAKTMAMVFCSLCVCYLPFIIVSVFLRPYTPEERPFWLKISLGYATIFVYFNSFLNAIIYSWRNKDFRKAMYQLVFPKKQLIMNVQPTTVFSLDKYISVTN